MRTYFTTTEPVNSQGPSLAGSLWTTYVCSPACWNLTLASAPFGIWNKWPAGWVANSMWTTFPDVIDPDHFFALGDLDLLRVEPPIDKDPLLSRKGGKRQG